MSVDPQFVQLAAAAFDHAPCATLGLDDEGRILGGNAAAEELLGYETGALRGLHVDELVASDDRPLATDTRRRAQAVGKAEVEVGMVRRDERTLWVSVRYVRVASGTIAFVEDVTQRRLEERTAEAIIAAAKGGVVTSDEADRILSVNPAALRMFGYEAPELLGKPLSLLVPERLRELHPDRQSALAPHASPPGTRSVKGVHKDGHELPIDISVSRIEIAGRVLFSSIMRDTTERDAMLARIHASEQRFSQVFKAVPLGLVLVGIEDDVVVEVNDAYLEMAGYERSQVEGHHFRSFVGDPEGTERIAAKFRRDGRVTDEPYTYRRADGTERQALISTQVQEIDGRRYTLVTVTDVTARAKAEEALRATAQRFQELADSIQEVFWLADPASGEITYASPAFESLWGFTLETFRTGRAAWRASIHKDDRDRIFDDMLGRQTRGEYDEEYRISRPDGEERWVHARAFPVKDPSGRVIRIAGVAEDVTKRHELEAQLRQTQKMESVGLLAGGIAHDFNNWLTVISGNAELLEGEHDGASAAELLREIRSATDRATSLTRQLLAFSRRDVVEKRRLDLNEVVRDAVKLLGRLLGEDIVIHTRLASSLESVIADPSHLTQVIMNLAVNARDAMSAGGELTISTSSVELRGDALPLGAKAGRHVVLSVRDTGSGMPPEVCQRIFEPFFTTKEVGRGTGLGLAVVHGIVQQSGGHVIVESEPGRGTLFQVFIPVTDARSDARPAPQEGAGTQTARETLLIVEDEDSVRRIAVRILSAEGYEVLCAGSGREALAMNERLERPVDLLITDVVMPKMNGAEVATAIRARSPDTRVIYTSGYTDDAVIRHGISSATVAFLPKPYTRATLLRKVREVLDD